MFTIVHFFENKTIVLSQLLENIPLVNDPIKIKGRKGTVTDVIEVEKNKVHVQVVFEKVNKKRSLTKEIDKRRR